MAVTANNPERLMVFRAAAGAMGVSAVALFFVPGLAAPFRLAKWAVWGLVLAVLALRAARCPEKQTLILPQDRRIFMAACVLALWSGLAPWLPTAFATAHVAGMLQLLMGLAFSWLVAMEIGSAPPQSRTFSLLILGLAGCLLSVLVFIQAMGVTLPGFVPALTAEFRATGTLGNPNWTAAFLLPLVPALVGAGSELTGTGQSRNMARASYLMAAIMALATIATLSKAGAVALAGGLVFYILLNSRISWRLRFGLATTMVVGCAAVIAWLAWSGLLQNLAWTRGRMFIWKGCLILIGRHPFTGFGLGGFQPAYPQALPLLTAGDPQAYMPLHRVEFAYQDILQTAVEGGFPAALLHLVLVFFLLRRAYRNGDGLSRGVGAAVAAMTFYGCFDSPLRLPATLALWWFWVGWLMAGKMKAPALAEEKQGGRPGTRAFLLTLIAVLGLFQAGRFALADGLWSRGAYLLQASEYTSAEDTMAAASFLVPENPRLLSESAKTSFLTGNLPAALNRVDRALATGFSFEDLFLRQKVLRQSRLRAAVTDEWRRMARDYPALLTPHIEIARASLKKGDLATARAEAETLLGIPQRDKRDWPYRAEAERILRRVQESGDER